MWTTNPSLLQRIKASDEISWREFYNLYKPFILRIGKNHSLSDEVCEELIQRSMMAMFNRSKTFVYDPSKGHFRGYLARLVRNQLVNILREESRQSQQMPLEDEECIQKLDEEKFKEEFDASYQNFKLSMALDELRQEVSPNVYEAFQLYVIQGQKPESVAKAMGISTSAIYVYKKRCQDKLKKIMEKLDELDE